MHFDTTRLQEPKFKEVLSSGHARICFSQCGEDAVLWHYLHQRLNGFYVDVGCHHPLRFSNTANLHNFYGWRGLNIDVDPDLIAAFDAARPEDINICAAVGKERGVMEATFFEESAVNSLDPETIATFKHHFKYRKSVTVEVYPLSQLLERKLPQGQHIDLMSIDVEGLDYDVLVSNDWTRFSPDYLAVEAHNFDLATPSANPTFNFLTGLGYKLISHCVVTSLYSK